MSSASSSVAIRITSNDVQLIDQTFGQGSFKQVVVGTWNGQQVAVAKYSNPVNPKMQKKLEEEFKRELVIRRSVNHENIVGLLAFCHPDQQNPTEPKLLVMERMDQDLEQLINSTRLDLGSKGDLMVQISRGMKYLHENGVFHRDLKPSNILVKRMDDSNGQTKWLCKVTDFGVSKLLVEMNSAIGTTGNIGTLLYSSPELFKKQSSGARSDVYSAAMTFFQLLTGRLPYDMQEEILIKSFKDESVRPEFKPGDAVPVKLQQVVQRMWSADKSNRPLFDELIAILNEVMREMAESAAAGGVAAESASGSASSWAASPAWPSHARPSNVEEWGVQEVVEWLGELGLDSYEHIFIQNKITGESLIELTQEDMKDMEINLKGDQIRLRKAIELLKRAPTSEPPSPVPQQAQTGGLAAASASQPAALRVKAVKKMEFDHVSSQTCRAIGSHGSKPGQLNGPQGILVDESTNHLIVSEWDNHRVQEVDEEGRHVRLFGNGQGKQPGQLYQPWGVTMSKEGRLIVCDVGNKRLQWWRKEDASHAGLFAVDSDPRCVAIGPSGDQLFVSFASNKIGAISMDGQPIGSMGHGEGSENGQLNWPVGLAFNSHGDLLVGDSWNNRISVFEVRSGQFKSKFGQFGGGYLHAAVDSFDRIIVSDCVSHRLALFEGGFESIGEFGSKGNQLGQFNCPAGVCVDEKNGRLLVCDGNNHRVQMVKDE